MKLHIPMIEQRLKLSSDWEFVLKSNWDNSTLWSKFGIPKGIDEIEVVVPAGTILTVKNMKVRRRGKADDGRIYLHIVRKHNKDSHLAGSKFFCTRDEANSIEFEAAE